MRKTRLNNYILLIITLFISSLILFLLDLFLGSIKIPANSIFNILLSNNTEKESWQLIILHSRLPKALTAVLCGSALAVSGLKMQSLFRNPLAGPYILGISAGASLGVALFVMGVSIFGISLINYPIFSNYGLLTSSILGSSLVLLILLTAIIHIKDIMTVLILGVMIGSVITAFISVLQYFSPDDSLKSFVLWTMGDLSAVSLSQLQFFTPVVITGLLISFFLSKKLNLYLLGEEYAKSLGLNVKQTQLLVIISTAILAGSVTAYCGPIGFIGIVVPHFARLLSKSSDHRKLTPLCILLGINILLLADIISNVPGNDGVLPINAITSFIGIPFIFWIIFKNKKMSSSF